MVTLAASPSLISHFELNRLIGERRRERWRHDGRLPEPRYVQVDRSRVALYPEVVLASVTLEGVREADASRALRGVVTSCERLFQTTVFGALCDAARDALAAVRSGGWDLGRFVSVLADGAPDVLAEWQAIVFEAEAELVGELVSFAARPGRVEERDSVLTVEFAPGDVVTTALDAALADVAPGADVVVAQVRVGARSRSFVLPAVPSAAPTSARGEGMMVDQGLERLRAQLAQLTAARPLTTEEAFGIPGARIVPPAVAFERGRIPGLLEEEPVLPSGEPEQVYSFTITAEL